MRACLVLLLAVVPRRLRSETELSRVATAWHTTAPHSQDESHIQNIEDQESDIPIFADSWRLSKISSRQHTGVVISATPWW